MNVINTVKQNNILSTFVTFLGVGSVATLVQYSILFSSIEFFSLNESHSAFFSFITAASLNYFLNYKLTFKSTSSHLKVLPKFVLVATIGLLLNMLIFNALITDFHYLIAQVIATLLVLLWNFIANLFWSFK